MGLAEVADGLAARVRLFEKCCLAGFVSYLADIQRCADYLYEKRFDLLDKGQLRQNIEDQIGVLGEFYDMMPCELYVIEPCNAHISMIDEFWGRYYNESKALLRDGRCDMSRLSSAENVLDCACESMLRCASIDSLTYARVERTQRAISVIRNSREMNFLNGDAGRETRECVGNLLDLVDSCVDKYVEGYFCDDDFAPVVVSGYLFQDLGYWTGEFLSSGSYESLEQMTKLSLAMSQLMGLFRKNYALTVDVLSRLPGIQEFGIDRAELDSQISVAPDSDTKTIDDL